MNSSQHTAQNLITLCRLNPVLLENRTDRLNTLLLGLAVCVHSCSPDESEPELLEYIAMAEIEVKSILGGLK